MESTRNLDLLHALSGVQLLEHAFLRGQYTRTAGFSRQEVERALAADEAERRLAPAVRRWAEQLLAGGLLWSDLTRPGFVSTLTDAQIAAFLHGSERDAESAHRLGPAALTDRPPVCPNAPITIAQFLEMAGVSPDMLIDVATCATVNVTAWFDLGPGTPRAVLEIQRPEVTYRLHSPVEEGG